VIGAAFGPDGGRIVTASADKTARVWDARSGAELLVLRGHTDSVNGASFSPDGARVVSASNDRTARVWDARNGAELLSLRGHRVQLRGAAFSPDGNRIVTTSVGETLFWDARVEGRAAANREPGGAVHPPDTYDAWAEDARRRQLLAPLWHVADYEAARSRGDRFAAEFHLRHLRTAEPGDAAGRVYRGLALLTAGYRDEGLAELTHPQMATDPHRDRLRWRALACLLRRDRAGYRSACAARLALLGPDTAQHEANSTLWICCLGPGATDDPGAVARRAEGLLAAGRPGEGGYGALGTVCGAVAVAAWREWWRYDTLNTYAAALLRAGNAREAVRRLQHARQLRGGAPQVIDELLLVLAYHQLGEVAEARKRLAVAAAWMDRTRLPAAACGTAGAAPAGVLPAMAALLAERPDPRASSSGAAFLSWLEMDILRAEAEAALTGTSLEP
jgi:hypothetical protein